MLLTDGTACAVQVSATETRTATPFHWLEPVPKKQATTARFSRNKDALCRSFDRLRHVSVEIWPAPSRLPEQLIGDAMWVE